MNTTDMRRIIETLQEGLPLSTTPYRDAAMRLGISEQELLERLAQMQESGVIRRIALVPNHYRLGYRHNAMTVWQIKEQAVDEVGETFAGQPWVSHCYRRPTVEALWPYNLFAMVHGRSREETEDKIRQLMELAGDRALDHRAIYSRKILKKTGLRLVASGDGTC